MSVGASLGSKGANKMFNNIMLEVSFKPNSIQQN